MLESFTEAFEEHRQFLAAIVLAATAATLTYTSTTHQQGNTFLVVVALMTIVGLLVGALSLYQHRK